MICSMCPNVLQPAPQSVYNIFIFINKSACPLINCQSSISPMSTQTLNLPCLCMDLPILDISHNQNQDYTMYPLLCLPVST